MNIEKYFNDVQEKIKELVVKNRKVDQNNVEDYNTDLMSQEPNIQKTIKKMVDENFKSNVDVIKTAQQIIDKYFNHPVVNNDQKIPNLNQGIQDTPNGLSGDRGMNTMERKIMNFGQFVNENNYNQFLNEKNRLGHDDDSEILTLIKRMQESNRKNFTILNYEDNTFLFELTMTHYYTFPASNLTYKIQYTIRRDDDWQYHFKQIDGKEERQLKQKDGWIIWGLVEEKYEENE